MLEGCSEDTQRILRGCYEDAWGTLRECGGDAQGMLLTHGLQPAPVPQSSSCLSQLGTVLR